MSDLPATEAARRAHWDDRYTTIGDTEVSWYEPTPTMSLEAFDAVGVAPPVSVLDVGGGASRLVDALLERGFGDVTVLDVSQAALVAGRERVGARPEVTWLHTDLLVWQPDRKRAVWHDRAVFHFLTDPADRATYRTLLREAVEPEGVIIVATFAADGPEWCSGLPVQRYTADELAAELGSDLTPVASGGHLHRTPGGGAQPFAWVALRR